MDNNCFNYQLSNTTKENIDRSITNALGISYDEISKLDFDEYQKIISDFHNSKHKNMRSFVMVGDGEHSIIKDAMSSKRVMIGSDEHVCFLRECLTIEDAKARLDKKLDDIVCGSSNSLIKGIVRRIKK